MHANLKSMPPHPALSCHVHQRYRRPQSGTANNPRLERKSGASKTLPPRILAPSATLPRMSPSVEVVDRCRQAAYLEFGKLPE